MIDPKRAPSELEGVVVGNLLIVMSCIDDYDPKPVRAAIENGRNRMNVPDMSQISSKRPHRFANHAMTFRSNGQSATSPLVRGLPKIVPLR